MKLYITEKKTVALALAPILGNKSTGAGGLSYTTANGDVVTWLSGHVLELFDAKDYDPKYATWSLSNLPILPSPFKLKEPIDRITALGKQSNARKRELLQNVLNLIRQADEICLGTDPDAEGELLGREVIEFSGYKGKLTRILPTSLEVSELKEKVNQEFCASKTESIWMSGLARSHLDWIIGINVTVGLTCYNNKKINTKLNTGRVQAAIIKILSLNHEAVENFKPQDTFTIKAKTLTNGSQLNLDYIPTIEEKNILNPKEDGYCSKKAKQVADNLALKLNGKEGVVSKCDKKRKSEQCPKGFSLTNLQIKIAKSHGIPASEVLEAAQKLYDQKFLTYPRTDSCYFPEASHDYADSVLSNLDSLGFCNGVTGIDPKIKNQYWDTSKFDNHHAILPTRNKPSLNQLSKQEVIVYTAVCERYIMQFLPDFTYDNTTIIVDIMDSQFKTSGNITIDLGWKQVLKKSTSLSKNTDEDEDEERIDDDDNSIPMVKIGSPCSDTSVFTKSGKTKCPPRHNEASVLSILLNPSKLMESKKLAKVLKDRIQGIGREATRATILKQMLLNGYYLVDDKKRWRLTEKGLVMAKIIPPMLLDLSLTAKLEDSLWKIEKGELTYDALMTDYKTKIHLIIDSINNGECELKEYLIKNTSCCYCKNGTMTQRKGKDKSLFWVCVDCLKNAPDVKGSPVAKAEPQTCSKCNEKSLRRFKFKDTNSEFAWYCKPCLLIVPDLKNKPLTKISNCEKCGEHINYGFSSAKGFAFWRCSNKSCNTFYRDENKTVGQMANSENKTEPCPKCNGLIKQFKRRTDGKKFWLCQNREVKNIECKASFEDDNDKPITQILEVDCPSCKDGILTLKDFKDRKFWGCNNYNNKKKQCKFSAKDNNGEPMLLLNN